MNAINYINHLDASRCSPDSENGVHHMTIILTNNSLIEGHQWNIRLGNDSKTRNVSILSSDKKRAKFSKSENFLGFCTTIKKPDELIDVLVVCNNHIRNNDINSIVDTFYNNRINLTAVGIHKCIFTVMFDEVDKKENLTNAGQFISRTEKYDNIDSIHLITATAYDNFWKEIKKITNDGKLKSLRHDISEISSPEKLIKDYRKIEEHNIHYVSSEYESGEYIIDVYERFLRDKQTPLRLFAPPNKYTETHEHIRNFFLKEDFVVVVLNGKSKEICSSLNESESIHSFNQKHFPELRDVEMYKTMTKLHQLFTDRNIVITGFNCVERGITFQTDGFNFTDMIIPPISNIASSVQLLGRANGGKQYVKKHNVYIQKEHYQQIEKRINYAIQLIRTNPEDICETDFRDKTNKEKDMIRWEVPIQIQLTKEQYYEANKRKGKGNQFLKVPVWDILRENGIHIDEKGIIDGYEPVHWLEPKDENDDTYRKNIKPLLRAIRDNEKICLLHKKHKMKNKKLYSVYFDIKHHGIIILKYDGDK